MDDASTLDRFYSNADPWGYDRNPYDFLRREILLRELKSRQFLRVLDVGCGNGFVTVELPGEKIWGLDYSEKAIAHAKVRGKDRRGLEYICGSVFDIPRLLPMQFDLVVVTGLLYVQYIHDALPLVYSILDDVLETNGTLVSVHIEEWYSARFPYFLVKDLRYQYREYTHKLELYVK